MNTLKLQLVTSVFPGTSYVTSETQTHKMTLSCNKKLMNAMKHSHLEAKWPLRYSRNSLPLMRHEAPLAGCKRYCVSENHPLLRNIRYNLLIH